MPQPHAHASRQQPLSPEVQQKLQLLKERIRSYGRIAIAFSGGVDSSLLLKIAHDTLGDNTLALFADSVLLTAKERHNALDMAKVIGASFEHVEFSPLSLPKFISNDPDRCYYCKKNIFSAFLSLAGQRNFPLLADGTNLDDLGLERPGMLAVIELGVKSPLADTGLTKHEIRQLSQHLGLSTWNKPSASCLATRIEPHTPITIERLALINLAEGALHELGYQGCRVRLSGTAFVVELAAGDISLAARNNDLPHIRDFLISQGAKKVFLDLLERESILS